MHSLPLQAETLFMLGSLPISNAVVATWLTIVVLVVAGVLIHRAIQTGATRGFWAGVVLMLEALVAFFEDLLGWAALKRLMSLLGTFFLFILLANWLGLLPGFGSITTSEGVPILRGATTDLHTTLALAIISIVVVQGWGLWQRGLRYLEKYVNVRGPLYLLPINLFVGVLELISEIAKIISFGFRLFGNIFAGEVLLTIMIGLIPLVVPSIFYGLELFVGFIQAFVFVLLSAVFLKLAGESHEAH